MGIGIEIPAVVLYGLGLAVGIMLVVRCVTLPRGVNWNCWCGQCGYELSSLEQQVCPECGSAHCHAGVVTPAVHLRLRGDTFLLNAGWSFLYALAALPVYWIVMAMVAASTGNAVGAGTMVTDKTSQGQFRPVATAVELLQAPSTGQEPTGERFMYTLTYDRTTRTRGTRLVQGTLSLDIRNSPAVAEMDIDLVDGTWVVTHADGSQTEGEEFGEAAVRAFYIAAGLDVSNTVTDSEIVSLVEQVDGFTAVTAQPMPMTVIAGAASSGPLERFESGSGSSSRPAAAFSSVGLREFVLVAGLLGYVVGLVLLNKRRSSIYKKAMAA